MIAARLRRPRGYAYPMVSFVLAAVAALVCVLVVGSAAQVGGARTVVAQQQAKVAAHDVLGELMSNAKADRRWRSRVDGSLVSCEKPVPGCVRVTSLTRAVGLSVVDLDAAAACGTGCATRVVRLRAWVRDGVPARLADVAVR